MSKMSRRKKKAIVGIEAAIVLIAFVIVAAALSFVVLNMGMFTTQRSKEVIARGLGEASTSLEIDGAVIGYVNSTTGTVTYLFIPIKLAPGREAVDFNESKLTVTLVTPDGAYENIYEGTGSVNTTTYDISTIVSGLTFSNTPGAKVIFINGDNDSVLEFGEKAVLVIKLSTGLRTYNTFTVEIKPIEGAPLTVERTIPPTLPSSGLVVLG